MERSVKVKCELNRNISCYKILHNDKKRVQLKLDSRKRPWLDESECDLHLDQPGSSVKDRAITALAICTPLTRQLSMYISEGISLNLL